MAKIGLLLQRPELRQEHTRLPVQSGLRQPRHWNPRLAKLPKGVHDSLRKFSQRSSRSGSLPRAHAELDGCLTAAVAVVLCGCRQVIDLVVDIRMWQDVFLAVKPELNKIAKLGTFCRDINMPLDAPDNCEAELPFFVMNITDEGDEGYVYMQHTSYWDYSKGSGAGKSDCA